MLLAIPFTDEASINNALTCCAVLINLKLPVDIIVEKIKIANKISIYHFWIYKPSWTIFVRIGNIINNFCSKTKLNPINMLD